MSAPPLRIKFGLLRVGIHLVSGAIQVMFRFPFADPAGRQRLRARWSHRLLACLGIRIEADHALTTGIASGLLVCNHISFIDVFVINAVLPSAFVAKSDVAGWPLIGWLARRNDTVFIQRGNRKAAHRTQQSVLAALVGGQRVAIFPEGTTTTGDRVLPFHGALLQSAIDAVAPVHALVLSYHAADGTPSAAPAYVDDLSVLDCLHRILQAQDLVARIDLAASFQPPQPDRRNLAHRAHQAVAAALAGATSS